MTTVTTARLRLRPLTEADAPFWLELHRNPDLVRFIPSAAVRDVEDAREQVDRYRRNGWLCVTLRDGTPVGAIAVMATPASRGSTERAIQIGWRTHAAHAGRGYATEAARELLSRSWIPGLPRIIAVVDPENEASKRVALAAGMTYVGRSTEFYDETLDVFEIRRPAPVGAVRVRPGTPDEIAGWFERHWGDEIVAVHGTTYRLSDLAVLIARDDERIVGVLTYTVDRDGLEIVTADAAIPGHGIGRRLVEAAIAVARERSVARV